MGTPFSAFLENYLDVWRASSLQDMKNIISQDYVAREITDGIIVDFGYEESVNGWEQGFHFAVEKNAQWIIKVVSILPIREYEYIAILSATLVVGNQRLDTANLFFQTFQKNSVNEWKLVRSYIEAGIPYVHTNSMLFEFER